MHVEVSISITLYKHYKHSINNADCGVSFKSIPQGGLHIVYINQYCFKCIGLKIIIIGISFEN